MVALSTNHPQTVLDWLMLCVFSVGLIVGLLRALTIVAVVVVRVVEAVGPSWRRFADWLYQVGRRS